MLHEYGNNRLGLQVIISVIVAGFITHLAIEALNTR